MIDMPKILEKFKKLGLEETIDFCFHFPLRYIDYYHAYPISHAAQIDTPCVLYLRVLKSQTQSAKRQRWLAEDAFSEVDDIYIRKNGLLMLQHPNPKLKNLPIFIDYFQHFNLNLKAGQSYFFYGELRDMGNHLQLVHPFVLSHKRKNQLLPVYRGTQGLKQTYLKEAIESQIRIGLGNFCEGNTLFAKHLFSGHILRCLERHFDCPEDYLLSTVRQGHTAEHASFCEASLGLALDLPSLNRLVQACLMTVEDAFWFLHHLPADLSDTEYQLIKQQNHPAHDIIKVYEFLAYQISILQTAELKAQHHILALNAPYATTVIDEFSQSLPWPLTDGQKQAWQQIQHDLQQTKPMQRLLQGDVGSGKTIVAILAALHVLAHGQQVVMMAPTEILARQLGRKFIEFLGDLMIDQAVKVAGGLTLSKKLRIEILVGSTPAKQKQKLKEDLAAGLIDVMVGTHALIQDDVCFTNLGLVIIDEQHRFGVRQRLKLKQKYVAHELMMSATPIPRTLAMGLYAYLDLATIEGLPLGRQAIQTKIISKDQLDGLIERLGVLLKEKAQVYWVCPLIEPAEDPANIEDPENIENIKKSVDIKKSKNNIKNNKNMKDAEESGKDLQTATDRFEYLNTHLPKYLPNVKIALLHGKLKSAEKNKIMQAFSKGEIDVLVATTVIEVGVDVPNANVMIIEDATQFGLAQLHQLRGRVGRGVRESYCILIYQKPIGKNAQKRLKVMQETQDGFIIAQKDLEFRGSGELLGQKQAGDVNFRLFDAAKDGYILKMTKDIAKIFVANKLNLVPFIEFWMSKNLEIMREQP